MFDLTAFITSIRWQDIVDISLNSYILFRLYVLFRGTNTFRVLIGIALLWFFQRVATFLGLIVTSWAIQGIMAVAALIIIIVFRHEIRSVLQAKNLKTILWGLSTKTGQAPNEIIAESIFDLSKRRYGALLVLPGKEDLSDIVQKGIPWRGVVSREMIMSIFWPDNPVHDGAAVLKSDRITEVGVILPLSSRQDLPSSYGTRHRAAAGLAEKTDALVIVVSEETGHVIVAKGSSITEIQTKKDLIRLLHEHTGILSKQLDAQKWEKLQLGIAGVVSVLFVLGIWFSFSRGLETLITLEIPVEYMNRDPGMEIVDTSSNAVSLHLSGSGALIKSIRSEQVKVRLDLSNAVVGRNTFTITPDNITLPPGIILKKVNPSAIDVTLDVPVNKELPIQVDWAGKLPEHLILERAALNPTKIRVIGGSRILEDIATIYTEKVPLDNLKKTGIITVNVALNPASLKVDSDSKEKVAITYVIKKRSRAKDEQAVKD